MRSLLWLSRYLVVIRKLGYGALEVGYRLGHRCYRLPILLRSLADSWLHIPTVGRLVMNWRPMGSAPAVAAVFKFFNFSWVLILN